MVRWSKGKYQVTRFCCTSGLCCECHARGNHGDKAKRKRVVHTDNVSKAWAEHVCAGWQEYSPTVERMPNTKAPPVMLVNYNPS